MLNTSDSYIKGENEREINRGGIHFALLIELTLNWNTGSVDVPFLQMYIYIQLI